MSDNPIIKADQVSYKYPKGEFEISGLNLTIEKEQITFILGRNGSGKTTLSKLMTGIMKPDAGNVYLGGKNTRKLELGEIGQMIGYLWQKPELQLFSATVMEELTFIGKLKKENWNEVKQKAEYWLDFFELSHLKKRSVFHLSRGEKQRLALAAVLNTGAKYLILDEPTKGLDLERKKVLFQLFEKMNQETKIGMCIISHDMFFREAFVQRREITMEKGKIFKDETI